MFYQHSPALLVITLVRYFSMLPASFPISSHNLHIITPQTVPRPPHSILIPILTKPAQVHYLQASSKPEPCWTLLGSASHMAVSLGFHQKTRKVDTYTAIELEEGKRAWWLCLIVEKSVPSPPPHSPLP
jgi:Fungal specific transcription factor domain